MLEVTFSEAVGPEAQTPVRYPAVSRASTGKWVVCSEARGHRNLVPQGRRLPKAQAAFENGIVQKPEDQSLPLLSF